jgi:hypothetical protein
VNYNGGDRLKWDVELFKQQKAGRHTIWYKVMLKNIRERKLQGNLRRGGPAEKRKKRTG